MWKSPPTRQLSREKRLEYECDIRERFYDDYIGQRNSKPTPAFLQSDLTVRLLFLLAAGDVGTDVLTGVHHLKFDPAIYRANALQGLMHDPARKLRRPHSNSSRDYILFLPQESFLRVWTSVPHSRQSGHERDRGTLRNKEGVDSLTPTYDTRTKLSHDIRQCVNPPFAQLLTKPPEDYSQQFPPRQHKLSTCKLILLLLWF